eukprot:GEMP01007122.1.p1 GENE.GEMP01007122.1~~GEMP01007122.1.p1  ORF type:complete len:843 (+),score=188.44 GEMP01007122.1:160-2688(+)
MEPGQIAERVKQFQVQQISVRGRKAAIGPKPGMTKLECIRKHRENIRKCATELGIEWASDGAIVPIANPAPTMTRSPTKFADEDVFSYLRQCVISPPHQQPRSAPATSSTFRPPWSIAQPSSPTLVPPSTFSPPRRVPSPPSDPSPPERYTSPTLSSSTRARHTELFRCISPRHDHWFDQQRQDHVSPTRLSPSSENSPPFVRSPPTRKSPPRCARPNSPVAVRYDDASSTIHARGGAPSGGARGSAAPAAGESGARTGGGLVDVNRSVEDLLAQWRAQHAAFQQEGISVLPVETPEIAMDDSFSDPEAVLRRIKLRLGVHDTSDIIAGPCAFAIGNGQLSANVWRSAAAPSSTLSLPENKPADSTIPRLTTASTMARTSRVLEAGDLFVAAPAADKEVVYPLPLPIPAVGSVAHPTVSMSQQASEVALSSSMEAPIILPSNHHEASASQPFDRELVGSAHVPPLILPLPDNPAAASILPRIAASSSPRADVVPTSPVIPAVAGDTTPPAAARKVVLSLSPPSMTSFLDNVTSHSQQSSNGLLDLITLPPDVTPISQSYERIRDSILSLSRDSSDFAAVDSFFARNNGESASQWPYRYDSSELDEGRKLQDLRGRYIAAVVERTNDGRSAAAVVKSVDGVDVSSTAGPLERSRVSDDVTRHPSAPDASTGSAREAVEGKPKEVARDSEIADKNVAQAVTQQPEQREQVAHGLTVNAIQSHIAAKAPYVLMDGATQHIDATWRSPGKEEATQTSFDFGESFVSQRCDDKRRAWPTEESGHDFAGRQYMEERYPWDHVERILRHLPPPPAAPPVPPPRRVVPTDDGVLKTYVFFRQQQQALLAR